MRLDWRLAGAGWFDVAVEIGGARAAFTIGYVLDPLDQLLDAAVDLVRGGTPEAVYFDEEPGEVRWLFFPFGDGSVGVRILRRTDALPRALGTEGTTLLDARCGVREFAEAVAQCAQRLLDAHGLDGYRALASRDFPSARLERLRAELVA